MEQNQLPKPHSLRYEGGKIYLSGVAAVENYDDKEAEIRLSSDAVHIRGSGLNVEVLDIASGTLTLSGRIQSLTYKGKGESLPFFKRLFK